MREVVEQEFNEGVEKGEGGRDVRALMCLFLLSLMTGLDGLNTWALLT